MSEVSSTVSWSSARRERRRVQPEVGEDARDRERMLDVLLAREPQLALVGASAATGRPARGAAGRALGLYVRTFFASASSRAGLAVAAATGGTREAPAAALRRLGDAGGQLIAVLSTYGQCTAVTSSSGARRVAAQYRISVKRS